MEHWTAKPTGDMTLSVVTDHGEQILRIDMLSTDTMKAGTDGDKLARSLNDLTIIASFPSHPQAQWAEILPYPDAENSPFPWSVDYNPKKRFLVVRDANNKKIADKRFSACMPQSRIEEILAVLHLGVMRWCSLNQEGVLQNYQRIANAHEDIRNAGYDYASDLYEDWSNDPEVELTKESIWDDVRESAYHDLGCAFEIVGRDLLKYLDWLDWEEIKKYFDEGIRRFIAEKVV